MLVGRSMKKLSFGRKLRKALQMIEHFLLISFIKNNLYETSKSWPGSHTYVYARQEIKILELLTNLSWGPAKNKSV